MKSPTSFDIVEIYSSESFLKLYWPNRVEVASNAEQKSPKDYTKFLKIEASVTPKNVLSFIFQTDQAVDHRATVSIITSKGDLVLIPYYFHVYTDLVKFKPSIIDFGIVPY
jgi:hypothetical protein